MFSFSRVPEISVGELKEKRDNKDDFFLLDVREIDEHEHCKINGCTLIPLGELQNRLDEIPRDKEIVVYCHRGGRSAQAVRVLSKAGYSNAKNLVGGIDAWACEIDSSVARY